MLFVFVSFVGRGRARRREQTTVDDLPDFAASREAKWKGSVENAGCGLRTRPGADERHVVVLYIKSLYLKWMRECDIYTIYNLYEIEL